MKIFAFLHSARTSRATEVRTSTAGSKRLVRRRLAGIVGLSTVLLAPSVIISSAESASACHGPCRSGAVYYTPARRCFRNCAPPVVVRPVRCCAPPVVVRPVVAPPIAIAPPIAPIYPPPVFPPIGDVGPGEVINLRYIVAIPSNDPQKLALARSIAPGAFITQSRLGNYINAGAFDDRDPAQTQADILRAYGLDAQVRYREF